jgi:hypothetical protein
MESTEHVVGWSKKVLSERGDGAHEWLDALYCCRTHVEAVTLQSCHSPTHVKRGGEVLLRRGATVYGSAEGHMFVVFEWRNNDPLLPLDSFDEV